MTRKRKQTWRKKSSPKRGRDVKKTTKRKASSSPARQREKEGEGARVQSALKLFFFPTQIVARACFFCLFSKRMLRALLTSDTVVWRWTHESLRARALLLSLSFRSSVRSASNSFARRDAKEVGRELKGSIERSNDERRRDDGEVDRSRRGGRRERFDVDADEPEDAISGTHDAG